MKIMPRLYIVFCLTAGIAQAQSSPYTGQEQHEIKALSPQEISDYFTGAGMGYAKAAELNNYPGPKHVLDLAKKLQLTEGQVEQTTRIFQKMNQEAVRLGKAVVHQERELDLLFAKQTIQSNILKAQTEKIAKLQGELRAVHLTAHLAMKEILSNGQVEKYNELRGYAKQRGTTHENTNHNH